ncbi:hypothetical protein SKAU_G00252800 [Synaphobranchus kaupii]|uniref:Uncharacterized protein n=1 Tax=Synaphobranchus kaupii TaxID=118154 RepID=A0A9Q1IS11_SYNKA|nr:hypothetical protein SKAU_G00252800 [Synaphobranchus kaupii]
MPPHPGPACASAPFYVSGGDGEEEEVTLIDVSSLQNKCSSGGRIDVFICCAAATTGSKEKGLDHYCECIYSRASVLMLAHRIARCVPLSHISSQSHRLINQGGRDRQRLRAMEFQGLPHDAQQPACCPITLQITTPSKDP